MIVIDGWHTPDNFCQEAKDAAKHSTPKPQRIIQQSLSAELSLRTPGVGLSDWKPEVKLSSLALHVRPWPWAAHFLCRARLPH